MHFLIKVNWVWARIIPSSAHKAVVDLTAVCSLQPFRVEAFVLPSPFIVKSGHRIIFVSEPTTIFSIVSHPTSFFIWISSCWYMYFFWTDKYISREVKIDNSTGNIDYLKDCMNERAQRCSIHQVIWWIRLIYVYKLLTKVNTLQMCVKKHVKQWIYW